MSILENNHVLNSTHLQNCSHAEKKDFAAILDTGFSGFAVCGTKWLSLFKNFVQKQNGYGTFDFREQEYIGNLTFTFGMDKVKNCLSIAIIPFWIEDKFFEIPVHVVQGSLELLLGQQFLRYHKVFIDCYSQKIKYGQGKWVATVSTDRGLLLSLIHI